MCHVIFFDSMIPCRKTLLLFLSYRDQDIANFLDIKNLFRYTLIMDECKIYAVDSLKPHKLRVEKRVYGVVESM